MQSYIYKKTRDFIHIKQKGDVKREQNTDLTMMLVYEIEVMKL